MKKVLIVFLTIGLIVCVGCGKEEQEVQLPAQKAPVGKEVPVAPIIQDKKELTKKQKEMNKRIYGNEEGGKYKQSTKFKIDEIRPIK